VGCQENNLSLNVNKTKEMIMDFRKQQREHPPNYIDGTAVEKVESFFFTFLGVHITDNLKWSTHTDSVMKKMQQCLFNLRRLKKFGLSPKTLTNLYGCKIQSILPGCITAWYGNCIAHNRRALQRVVGANYSTPGHLQHLMSQEGQKDCQIQQPPKPLPVHPTNIQKAKSVQVHQSWDEKTSDC
jgi:hypothetical protein